MTKALRVLASRWRLCCVCRDILRGANVLLYPPSLPTLLSPLPLFFHYNIHLTAASKPEHMAVTCVQARLSYRSDITKKLQLQTRKQLEVSYDMTVSVYWCVDQ